MHRSSFIKILLITITTIFLVFMLVIPLASVLFNALSKGLKYYMYSLSTQTVISSLKNTLFVTSITVFINTFFGIIASWVLTRYSFTGKQLLITLIDIPFSVSPVIAGLAYIMMFGRMGWATPFVDRINEITGWNIKIVFAIPGVILATIFVTFPLVAREIIPVLNSIGTKEEEAAALMGANGFNIFKKVTFPHIKWAIIYGVVLCTARAMGEFGAVNALSKTRGKTFTLPQEIDALYMSGSSDSIVAAYSVSSILVLMAIVMLIVKCIMENMKIKNRKEK